MMEGSVKRVLFVNSEMSPYLKETEMADTTLNLSQGIQDQKVEIRTFMPRYGLINERKNQLHEVIRLSGMNIIINDVDRPLIIKVASLPSARMQVYFIDNDDFFHRKALFNDASGAFFKDNAERAVFFARGVLETVKKLRWSPDVIHCSGWISHVLPLYLKKCYKDDPIFANSKISLALHNDIPTENFGANFGELLKFQGVNEEDVKILDTPSGINLAKLAIDYSDGVIAASADVPAELIAYAKDRVPVMEYKADSYQDGSYIENYKNFYDKL